MVLVGSRARDAEPDDLADIDVQVYTTTPAVYTQDDRWLSELGEIWVCVRDAYVDGDVHVATRLVILAPGVKVDFAFYPADASSAGIRSGLPWRTLLDKGPSAEEFRRVIEEFWFEAYHVAKYLARGELQLAKSRDRATKHFLLTMVEWHRRFAHGETPELAESASNESGHELLDTTRTFRRVSTETAAALRYTYPADVDTNLSRLIDDIRQRHGQSS